MPAPISCANVVRNSISHTQQQRQQQQQQDYSIGDLVHMLTFGLGRNVVVVQSKLKSQFKVVALVGSN